MLLDRPSHEDPLFNAPRPLSRNRAKLDQCILATAADFVTATILSCRQVNSPVMHEFILKLIQIGAYIQVNDHTIDIAGLLDQMTESSLTEAIRPTDDPKFAQAIIELSEIRFANIVVDARTVQTLKTIRRFSRILIRRSRPFSSHCERILISVPTITLLFFSNFSRRLNYP
jgi:hypothetical protein